MLSLLIALNLKTLSMFSPCSVLVLTIRARPIYRPWGSWILSTIGKMIADIFLGGVENDSLFGIHIECLRLFFGM